RRTAFRQGLAATPPSACVRTRCEGASISALATHQEGVARRDERHPPSRADVSHAIRLSVCVMREVSYKKFGETTDKESIRHAPWGRRCGGTREAPCRRERPRRARACGGAH